MPAHRPDVIRRERMPDDVRAHIEAERLTAKPSVQSVVRIVVVIATYAGLFVAAGELGTWWGWAAVWFLQAVLLAGMYSFMHEATHFSLFGSARANRAAATFGAGVLLVNASQYRAFHMHHHAYTRQENIKGDPVEFRTPVGYVVGGIMMAGFMGFALPVVVGSLASLFNIYAFYVKSDKIRADVRRAAWLHLALVITVVAWAVVDFSTVASLWLVPLALFYCAVFGFVSEPEHYGLMPDGSVYETTRTMRANPVFSFFYWDNQFHTEHHLAPGVPYAGLRRLHAKMDPQRLRVVGYWSFHLGVLRDLAREKRLRSAGTLPATGTVSGTARLQRGW
jgi:fatty acid desaturase